MKMIKAKTILQTTKHGEHWFSSDYGVNLYRGCCHGCIYCDSRSNCYRVDNFDEVTLKENALTILSRELMYKKKGIVGFGAMCDHYNPFEKQLEITRSALELIKQNGFGLSLETKSAGLVRDIDIFQEIQKNHNLILKLTITCADDALSKKIEPYVSPSSERFAALKQLSDAGLFAGVLFTPWLPFITDNEENIKSVVKQAFEAGAKFVFAMDGVTLRENQRDYYYARLDELYPGLSDRYRRTYRDHYMCRTLDKRLMRVFREECKRYGMLYQMKDIIQAYKRPIGYQQETLF